MHANMKIHIVRRHPSHRNLFVDVGTGKCLYDMMGSFVVWDGSQDPENPLNLTKQEIVAVQCGRLPVLFDGTTPTALSKSLMEKELSDAVTHLVIWDVLRADDKRALDVLLCRAPLPYEYALRVHFDALYPTHIPTLHDVELERRQKHVQHVHAFKNTKGETTYHVFRPFQRETRLIPSSALTNPIREVLTLHRMGRVYFFPTLKEILCQLPAELFLELDMHWLAHTVPLCPGGPRNNTLDAAYHVGITRVYRDTTYDTNVEKHAHIHALQCEIAMVEKLVGRARKRRKYK